MQKAEAGFLCGQSAALMFLPALQKATNSWNHCGGKNKNTVLFSPLYKIAHRIIDGGLSLLLCNIPAAVEKDCLLLRISCAAPGLGDGGSFRQMLPPVLCLLRDGAHHGHMHLILTLGRPGILSFQTFRRDADSKSGKCK